MRPAPQSFLRQPLSQVFASPANVRVLRELVRHGGELASATLAERARLSKPGVLACLDQLAVLGYVELLGTRTQRLYRVDWRHPLASVLADLFAAEDHRFQTILEAIRTAALEIGAPAAWLYGSVARGQDGAGSDVDVAIVAPGDAAAAKAQLHEILRSKEDQLRFSASLIVVTPADVVRLSTEQDPWWINLVKDAAPLVGPDPAGFAARKAHNLGSAV